MNKRTKSSDYMIGNMFTFSPRINRNVQVGDKRPIFERIYEKNYIQNKRTKSNEKYKEFLAKTQSSPFFNTSKGESEIFDKLYSDFEVGKTKYKELAGKYKIEPGLPTILKNPVYSAKLASRESDFGTRLFQDKQARMTKIEQMTSSMDAMRSEYLTWSPKVDYEKFKETGPLKEREGQKFQDYLFRSSEEYKNYLSKLDDDWKRIYTNECYFIPKIQPVSKKLTGRPKSIHEELFSRERIVKPHKNLDLRFRPNTKKGKL